MPDRQRSRTRPVALPGEPRPEHEPAPTSPVRLTVHQFARWAELIAAGRGDFPTDLVASEQYHLLVEVRSRLRDRLVQHLARAIAASVHRDTGPRSETDSHAGP